MALRRSTEAISTAAHLAAAIALLSLAVLVVLSRAAAADMASALESCLEPREPEAHVALLETGGWMESTAPESIDAALRDAMTLTFLRRGEPETWAETADRSVGLAERSRGAVGYDAVRFLWHPSGGTLTLEPDRFGNPTCLYVGPETDLSAFDALGLTPVSDGTIGRIRHDSETYAVRFAATSLNTDTDAVEARSTFTAVHLRPPRG